MTTTPEFTVVIPTHNGAAYIGQAVESLLKQTYPHFEIIVLEHESTDATVAIAQSYHDPRIRICSAESHQTIESNWARMLDLELAEYLTILGHDDVFYPEFLQEMADLIAAEPDASLYVSHFHIIDSDGKVIRSCKPTPYRESGEEFMRARQHFQRDNFATGYVMRSADYKRIGGFKPIARLIFADDLATYSLAAISGKACSPKFLFGYRYHLRSESYMSGLDTLVEASQQFISALQETPYAENPANIALAKAYLNKTFTRRYIRILVNLLYSGETEKLPEYYAARQNFLKYFPNTTFSTYYLMAGTVEFVTRLRIPWLRGLISKTLYYVVKIARGMKN